MANEVAKKEEKKTGITSYLTGKAVKENIVSVIGEKSAPTFISSIISAVQTNKELANCTNSSILSAALLGESLKLTPSPQLGQFYMVPYKNKGVAEATFQLGYKGYIQLAIRSGQYRKIAVSEVKEGELASFNPITEEYVLQPITDMTKRNALKTIGYYAMFILNNGFRKDIYWSLEEMESHAKTYSAGYRSDLKYHNKNTFWSKNFDAMAKKTLIRQLISKWGIMSIDMQKAYNADMAVVNEDGTVEYVDNPVMDVEAEVIEDIEENSNKEEFIDMEEAGEQE